MKQGNQGECTIEKYVKDKYRYQLGFLDYLCLHVGDPENKVYLPEPKEQSLPLSKYIDNNQCQNMIRNAANPPAERCKIIENNLRRLSNYYDCDP